MIFGFPIECVGLTRNEDRSWEDVQDDADSFEQRVFHALESELVFPTLPWTRTDFNQGPAFQHQDQLPEAAPEVVSSRQSQESLPVKFRCGFDDRLDLEELANRYGGLRWYNPQRKPTRRLVLHPTSAPEKLQTGFSPFDGPLRSVGIGVRTDPLPRIFSLPLTGHRRLSTSQPHDEKYWNYIRLDGRFPTPSKRPSQTPLHFENSVLHGRRNTTKRLDMVCKPTTVR